MMLNLSYCCIGAPDKLELCSGGRLKLIERRLSCILSIPMTSLDTLLSNQWPVLPRRMRKNE